MQLDAFTASMPLAQTLGIEVLHGTKDEVRMRMPWRPEICTSNGIVHGGALMALADSCGAACAVLNLPEGAFTTTIESKTNFLGAVRDGAVSATATPLHRGGTTIVVETTVRDEAGKMIAKVTQTQLVLRRRG